VLWNVTLTQLREWRERSGDWWDSRFDNEPNAERRAALYEVYPEDRRGSLLHWVNKWLKDAGRHHRWVEWSGKRPPVLVTGQGDSCYSEMALQLAHRLVAGPAAEKVVTCAAPGCDNRFARGGGRGRPTIYCSVECEARMDARRKRHKRSGRR
jgi:hypothetical protein